MTLPFLKAYFCCNKMQGLIEISQDTFARVFTWPMLRFVIVTRMPGSASKAVAPSDDYAPPNKSNAVSNELNLAPDTLAL